MEQIGIENIKKGIGAVISLAEAVEAAKKDDDKITAVEAISITVKSIPDVYNIAKNFSAIRNEYVDLSNTEREDIKEWVRSEFDIDNDFVEAKIEAAFDIAIAIEKYFSIKKAA